MPKQSDDTPLALVIESPRAAKALEEAGYAKVGDLDGVSYSELGSVKGVGERTLERIRELRTDLPEEPTNTKVEEGMHPIHLHSPSNGFCLHLLPGDRLGDKFGYRLVTPVFIEFSDGRGRMTAELWFTRKYRRDMVKVQDAIANEEPWRVEAHKWLASRRSCNSAFFIMTD